MIEPDNGELPGIPDEHFISLLAIDLFPSEDGTVIGSAPVRPEGFAPGTTTLRSALLATMVDMTAGYIPSGAVGPTVDLRLELFAPPPTTGRIHLVGRPLKVGGRMVISETTLYAGADGPAFGRSITNFMKISVGAGLPPGERPLVPMPVASFDELFGARIRDARSIEVDAGVQIANGVQGTIQGGAQAFIAEMAAEHALGGGRRLVARDIDMRYLSKLKVGPMVATVEPLAQIGDEHFARVALTDAGADGLLVSYVSLTLQPA